MILRLELQFWIRDFGHDQGPPPCSVPRCPRRPLRSRADDPECLSAQSRKTGTPKSKYLFILDVFIPSVFADETRIVWCEINFYKVLNVSIDYSQLLCRKQQLTNCPQTSAFHSEQEPSFVFIMFCSSQPRSKILIFVI